MTPTGITRVLFVCIGNSCRSQMAEGFARTYGSDCLVAVSAGLAPAARVAADTRRAMEEKNIDLSQHYPKSLRSVEREPFDIIVNMAGTALPGNFGEARILDWAVPDPISLNYANHRAVRDDIERRVMTLILELRRSRSHRMA